MQGVMPLIGSLLQLTEYKFRKKLLLASVLEIRLIIQCVISKLDNKP